MHNRTPEDPPDLHTHECETCYTQTTAVGPLCESCAAIEDISESIVEECDWCYGQGIEGYDSCPQCGEGEDDYPD